MTPKQISRQVEIEELDIEEVAEQEPYDTYYIGGGEFKAWMSYTALTATNSVQYELQQMAYTNEYGLRCIDGRCLVAIGTYFNAPVGTYFDIVFSDGSILNCIVGDIKADIHTDENNLASLNNGSIVEFIVDTNCMSDYSLLRGTIMEYPELIDTIIVWR